MVAYSERIIKELKMIMLSVKEFNVNENSISRGKAIKKLVLNIEDKVINELYDDLLTYISKLKEVLQID